MKHQSRDKFQKFYEMNSKVQRRDFVNVFTMEKTQAKQELFDQEMISIIEDFLGETIWIESHIQYDVTPLKLFQRDRKI